MSSRIKGGNMRLNDVVAPDSVNPGDTATVTAVVTNVARFIAFDQDQCANGSNPCSAVGGGNAGYCYEVEYRDQSGNVESSGPICIGNQTQEVDMDFEVNGSDGQEITFEARVVMSSSRESTDWQSTSVLLTEDEPIEADPPDDQNGNGGGPDLLGTIVNNPIKTAVAAGAIGVALRLTGD